MRLTEFIRANLRYVIEVEPGSFIDTVVSKQPLILPNETNADLHTHPYIASVGELQDTLDVMVENNVDLCAITTHGKGDSREFDFWKVKKLIEENSLADILSYQELSYQDLGLAFQVTYKGKTMTFVGAYEMYVHLDGIQGRLDIISLMPERGFENAMKPELSFKESLRINQDYNAIVSVAHPYTIWDSYGPAGLFKFRLGAKDDRKRIAEEMFPQVDVVDLVSTNCAWMIRSDELVERDYLELRGRKPLANSDAHSTRHLTRKEMGRSGNIFVLHDYSTGAELRGQLRGNILSDDFRTYHNHSPSIQFLLAIALNKPAEGYP